ncbi:MAG: hypothetical protein R2867_40570 [Caldilineaceae bacterium]
MHFDLRANILLTDEQVWIVDWLCTRPCVWVCPRIDLVCFAPSVTMQGGPEF